jgi:iron(III) transport system substrate-binding protein
MVKDPEVSRILFGPDGRRMARRAFGATGLGAFVVACGGEVAPASKSAEPTKAPAVGAPTVAPTKAAEPTKAPAAASDPATNKLSVMASPQQDWIDAQVAAFKKVTSIDTVASRLSGGEGLAKLKAEGGNPSFDVWWGSPIDSFISAQRQDLLVPFKPESATQIPDKYKDKDGFWHGIYVGSIAFAVNTKRLQEKGLPEPQTWEDLTKPAYKGEVVIAHPSTSGTSYTSMQTVLQLKKKNEDDFWKWAKALHTNVLQYTKSGSGPMGILERAEASIGVVFSHDIFVSVEKGLPIKIVFPTDGTGYEIGGMALIKGAKNVASAKRWIDWALTVEGQEIGATAKAYQAPTNPKAKVPKPEFLQVKLIDYDFVYAGTVEEKIRTKFTEDIAPQPKS